METATAEQRRRAGMLHNLHNARDWFVTTPTAECGLQPYTIPPGTYAGNLIFWPGSIVSVNQSVAVDIEHPNVVGVGLITVHCRWRTGARIMVRRRRRIYGMRASVTTANNSVPNQTATLMTDGGSAGGGQTVSKGV